MDHPARLVDLDGRVEASEPLEAIVDERSRVIDDVLGRAHGQRDGACRYRGISMKEVKEVFFRLPLDRKPRPTGYRLAEVGAGN